jgi:hypothetical protein
MRTIGTCVESSNCCVGTFRTKNVPVDGRQKLVHAATQEGGAAAKRERTER